MIVTFYILQGMSLLAAVVLTALRDFNGARQHIIITLELSLLINQLDGGKQ